MSTSNEGRRGSTQTNKSFLELSDEQKNRRAEELSTSEIGKLLLASAKVAKDSNLKDLEFILRLPYNNHGKAKKMRSLFREEKSMFKSTKINPLRGLISSGQQSDNSAIHEHQTNFKG